MIGKMSRLRRNNVTLGGLGFLGAFFLALLWPTSPRVEQPIRYNHEKHLAAGLQCADCHTLYSSTAWASLPAAELCLTCHEQPLTESPEEAKMRELAQQGQALQWKQVNQLPTHVYFSHKTHAVSREIACAVCHGPMEKASTPPTRPFQTWTMDTCMDCHQRQSATVDCNGCHR